MIITTAILGTLGGALVGATAKVGAERSMLWWRERKQSKLRRGIHLVSSEAGDNLADYYRRPSVGTLAEWALAGAALGLLAASAVTLSV